MGDGKVMVLHPWQVWDPAKGCFFVGLKPTKKRHRGNVVYEDAFKQKLVILGTEEAS